MNEILRLKKSNCKNCYKCIRHCPVKAIRFSAGQAHVVGDSCVLCGQCFAICPQNTKQISSDLEKVRVMLMTSPVYASIAPSFAAVLDEIRAGTLHRCFIELSACQGSCANGPLLGKRHPSPALNMANILRAAGTEDFPVEQPDKLLCHREFTSLQTVEKPLHESQIRDMLAKMGKHTPEDELNCCGCGMRKMSSATMWSA